MMRIVLGFALLLAVDDAPVVSTLRDLGPALTVCYRAPEHSEGSQVTIRFSLTSRGSILGKPMVTYSKLFGSQADQRAFVAAIFDALRRCTPINLSPDLGRAVAGRLITLHVVGGAPAIEI